jgi:hypothetical protein
MNAGPVIRALTKILVMIIFWVILGFSLFLTDDYSFNNIMFILAKSFAAAAIFWVLMMIAVDSVVRSMVAAAREKQADRFKGGLSYHFTEPSKEEKQWQEQHREEIEAYRRRKQRKA